PTLLPDAALLAEVPEDILCFSRTFEDLTCFWDEEEEEAASRTCHFYYWDEPKACVVSTWRIGAVGTRHACVFPSQDVRLFTQLHLHVLNATTNQTKYWRELSVDMVGLVAPPANISARWAGAAGQLYVSWQPPLTDYLSFFLYEVRCCPASSPEVSSTLDSSGQHPGDSSREPSAPPAGAGTASPGAEQVQKRPGMSKGMRGPQPLPSLAALLQGLVQANTWVVLRDLQPGLRYHIQVRSKPDGTSMDGIWGPWSQAVAAETPRSSRDIELCCSTADLQHMRCEWRWDPAEPRGSHQLFYRPPPSGAGTREDTWQQCEEMSVGTQGTHACTFQPPAGSAISVLVNITQPHAQPTRSYFKEPFWLHEAVLTNAPQLIQATVSQGRLSLQWLPPLEALAEQLDYQVRYAVENSHDWKVLQVPRAARKEVLDLRPGARYQAQVRAQPSGPLYQGSWSAWSEPVVVDAMADAGKRRGRSGGCSQWSCPAKGRRERVGNGTGSAVKGSVVAALGVQQCQRSSSDSGWILPSITVVPLLFTGVLLGLRCTFPSLYSNMKQKLWPPVPDLHRALGSFLHESSKHSQAFYKQPPEEPVLPCLLEVLPSPQREPRSPPERAASRLPSTDIANQSYLLLSGWEPRGPTPK
ncbi:TPOR protein, partial [Crotophaga sulcirostris]|nr:TPOR protein [Crotophaga sulcirostris]